MQTSKKQDVSKDAMAPSMRALLAGMFRGAVVRDVIVTREDITGERHAAPDAKLIRPPRWPG